jgi:hypothetical protein
MQPGRSSFGLETKLRLFPLPDRRLDGSRGVRDAPVAQDLPKNRSFLGLEEWDHIPC